MICSSDMTMYISIAIYADFACVFVCVRACVTIVQSIFSRPEAPYTARTVDNAMTNQPYLSRRWAIPLIY